MWVRRVNEALSGSPRFVIAAPASGHGKTTLSVGIMAALRRRGLAVAPFKVGPDYIDPGYHALATGRPGRNLDPWLQSEELLVPLFLHGSRTPAAADISVIEGVMGLFDGRLGTDDYASTAHIARVTDSPVVVVADVSSASRTIAASLTGLRVFDERINVAGVILNKAGSPRHFAEVARACEQAGLPVLGGMSRDTNVSVPSRHLGLVPAAERDSAAATLEHLANQVEANIDLDALLELGRSAPTLAGPAWEPERRHTQASARVAVAGGRAFTFRYAETTEMLAAQGIESVTFDPISDTSLPENINGLYLGGGFPEVHAKALSGNTRLLSQLRDAVRSGMPTVAECAGLLYLLRRVDGHTFAGAINASAAMHPRLTLGYRTATAPGDSLLTRRGDVVRGHEFHRTATTPGAGDRPAWTWDGRCEGFTSETLHASYLHTHWAGSPAMAQRFADAVHAFDASCVSTTHGGGHVSTLVESTPSDSMPSGSMPPVDDGVADPLLHHGDEETDPTLVDFAVNVRSETPPKWLRGVLAEELSMLGRYPRLDAAVSAIAQRHGVAPDNVLVTSGAAEAFTLIARALPAQTVGIVEPQFTEPAAAMRAAGRTVTPLMTDVSTDFVLDPGTVADDVDLVMIGNPTNPTGRLHPRAAVLGLRRPGRVVVVDEAFMDAVVDESESLLTPGASLTDIVVIRSLTKTWALAGLRAGYVVGDAELIRALREQQPHWSVSSLAIAAICAVLTPGALKEQWQHADDLVLWREHLQSGLRNLGIRVVDSSAPFVLAQIGFGVRNALRDAGFAVRRADTFAGLDGSWARIAVREPATVDALLRTWRELVAAR